MCPADGQSRKTKGARNGRSGCLMDCERRGEKSYNREGDARAFVRALADWSEQQLQ